jgi:hypothetical protein
VLVRWLDDCDVKVGGALAQAGRDGDAGSATANNEHLMMGVYHDIPPSITELDRSLCFAG